ncbi:unnamed protein product [Gongylonema pulchrum]|uniref:Transmembrane protein n=1 Tax=Gongylonema pulchrum TaxID=637853 RepID=A0A183DBC2_9BILA|nr:unnamed protein product [Gongylonema pulchrum]
MRPHFASVPTWPQQVTLVEHYLRHLFVKMAVSASLTALSVAILRVNWASVISRFWVTMERPLLLGFLSSTSQVLLGCLHHELRYTRIQHLMTMRESLSPACNDSRLFSKKCFERNCC